MENNNLKKYVDDFFDNLELYDDYHNGHNYKSLLKSSIDMFLDYQSDFTAIKVYEMFFSIYQITSEDKSMNSSKFNIYEPNFILDIIRLFFKYQNKSDLNFNIPIHSINVFILGLSIYSQNNNYRKAFESYVLNSPYKKYYKTPNKELSDEEFLYRWGITSLLHDMARPVELLSKPLRKRLGDEINSICGNYGMDKKINLVDFNESNFITKMKTDFADEFSQNNPYSKFLDLFKPTDIMAYKLSYDLNINLYEVSKELNEFTDYMQGHGFLEHSFVSSVLTLNFYGYLIQNHAKDYKFFFYPIVDSATAILLYCHYGHVLQKSPFDLSALHPLQSPLSYLLILCDEIQMGNMKPDLTIDDGILDVCYNADKDSFSPIFNEYLEEYIKGILSIPSIFMNGFRISVDAPVGDNTVGDNNLREILKSEIKPHRIPLKNVEKIAIQIHQNYLDIVTAKYEKEKSRGEITEWTKEKYESLTSFEDLNLTLKLANIRQAKSIPEKLNFIGCELADLSDKREPITFTNDEILDLAILEHEQWCEEKIASGWVYGEKMDYENLVNPYLVPWDQLSPEIQQYDIDSSKDIPNIIRRCGLKIVRNKISLLSFEIAKFSDIEPKPLHELPNDVRHMTLILTYYLMDILSEIGYSIVGLDEPNRAILALTEIETEYLAEKVHKKWCNLKFSLGWKYGSVLDEEMKLNPKLVDWFKLNRSERKSIKKKFEYLPVMCRNADLKIVKI